jgi:hypothetical protein
MPTTTKRPPMMRVRLRLLRIRTIGSFDPWITSVAAAIFRVNRTG